MYVVGANLLSEHWREHPESEGELRALHALLASSESGAIGDTFGRIASFDGGTAELKLRTARVRIEISAAAGLARYAAVFPAGQEDEE